MSQAVCIRCGRGRSHYDRPCPACGHRPTGEGLLVAWLLSSEHLGAADLEAAGERIRAGEPIHPSERQLDRARRALGRHYASDPGLSTAHKLLLFATSLLLTPLPGWVLWWWWRSERPRASMQALALCLPATVLFTGGVLWLRLAA